MITTDYLFIAVNVLLVLIGLKMYLLNTSENITKSLTKPFIGHDKSVFPNLNETEDKGYFVYPARIHVFFVRMFYVAVSIFMVTVGLKSIFSMLSGC
jgi:hypothetical protein